MPGDYAAASVEGSTTVNSQDEPRRTMAPPWSAVTDHQRPTTQHLGHATWHGPAFQSGGPSWPPPDVDDVPAPHPPTYDTSAAPPPIYGGAPAFLPNHPTAEPPEHHVTEPIPTYRPTARGTARPSRHNGSPMTLGDVLTILGGVLVLAFSMLPFVSYTDERFVAVENRADLATSWTAWSPSTFLAPLSWVAIVAAVLVTVLGVLRVLERGHRTMVGVTVEQARVLLAGLGFLILFSFAVSSKTVLFGDDRPQLTAAGVIVDSTLSLDSGGYLMLLAAAVQLAGAVWIARGAGGPAVWPLPDSVRTMFAKRTR
ncbi:hypothetical protein CryarDRAFT_0318 [Cryptosporangium arvum DSM 44712]|uniref:Uncharacterized protein n=1 Tax=Cryptosporangium arvum DSM 44712 TaxID=927661 RepID=A0A011ABB7_9ACTN|nr:hypothetical protein CryarDRAFT_0318 [Cryptosporangium arvum DSM 44712]